MNFLFKYFSEYLQYKFSKLIAGRKDYEAWKAKNYSLKKVKIDNKLLAKELMEECEKKGGSLTYSEFLHVDQFGKNGYHSRYKDHGITTADAHWAKALAVLCKEKDYYHVLEVGPGKGDLAVNFIKNSRKLEHSVSWSGIEINKDLRKIIRERFKKKNLERYLKTLVGTPKELKKTQKSLVVFSYSLDSIPPEIFINASSEKAQPNSILGIKVKNGILQEFVLNKKELNEKRISIKNGVYKDINGFHFDLSSWSLFPFQRAYISIPAFSLFLKISERLSSDSMFLIIDEFRQTPPPWETNHFSLPKDLYRFKRDIDDLEQGYKESGNNLLYYSMYFHTFLKFLQSGKFSSIQYEIEEKMAKDLAGQPWINKKKFFTTYAFLARNKKNSQPAYSVFFPK